MAAQVGTHLVDADSTLAASDQLNLFNVPTTDISINGSYWVMCRPKNNLDDKGPWQFEINTGQYYGDFTKNLFYMKLKLVKEDGTDPAAAIKVAPINMIASTFFKTVRLFVQGKLISHSQDLYGYRVIIETELNYDKGAKQNGHLQSAMYFQDAPGGAINTEDNIGWQKRKTIFSEGKEVEMLAPIRTDLFNTSRLIPTHTNIGIELVKNENEFLIMKMGGDTHAEKYKFVVKDMKWYVNLVDISNTAHLTIEKLLAKVPAKYPVRNVRLVRINVPANSTRIPNHTLFQGQIPRRVIVALVARNAFNGNDRKSPFYFQHFGLKEISLTAGNVTYLRDPLKTDFPNNIYQRAYSQLLEAIGKGPPNNIDTGIDLNLYKDGLCFFGFDLSPDKADMGHWNLIRQGNTVLNAEFDASLTEAVEIIVYAEFDGLIRIDKNRDCFITHM